MKSMRKYLTSVSIKLVIKSLCVKINSLNQKEDYFSSVEKAHSQNFCSSHGKSWSLNERKHQCIIAAINIYFGRIVFKSHEDLYLLFLLINKNIFDYNASDLAFF